MKTLIVILILSLATIATAAFIRSGDVWLKYGDNWMSQGDPSTTTTGGISGDGILLESGDFMLLETGDYALLE